MGDPKMTRKCKRKCYYKNPNRLIIDILLMRLNAMYAELSEIAEVINDLIWTRKECDKYEQAINTVRQAQYAVAEATRVLTNQVLEVEPPWNKIEKEDEQ